MGWRVGFCLSEPLLLSLVQWTRQIRGLRPQKELLVVDGPLIARTGAVFTVWCSYVTRYHTTHAHTHALRKPNVCKSIIKTNVLFWPHFLHLARYSISTAEHTKRQTNHFYFSEVCSFLEYHSPKNCINFQTQKICNFIHGNDALDSVVAVNFIET